MASVTAPPIDKQMGNDVPRSADRTPSVITTGDEYAASLQRWNQNRMHVLTPVANFSGLAAQHAIIAAVVQLNPDPAAGDVYQDKLFCGEQEVAIAKIGLTKIAQAAGISITTERVDPRTLANYWEVRATARWRGIDGAIQEAQATVEYDLRDGSARVRNFTEKQKLGARAHGLRGAESRAINAAIRQFGIRQKYTRQELAKPFVTVRVMFQPDMSDEMTRRLVTERALDGTARLYAHTAAALPAPEHLDTIDGMDVETHQPRTVGSGSTSAPVQANAPGTNPTLLVVDVTERKGTTGGRDWTVYRVSFSDGRYGGTFDKKLADKAWAAARDKAPIREATIDESGKNPTLTKLELESEEQDVPLPLDMPDLGNGEMKL